MAQLITYLSFSGNTREAMNFYKECLGGEVEYMPVAGSPAEPQMPDGMKQGILHSELKNGSIRLMATDTGSAQGLTAGNNFSIFIECGSVEEINRFYSVLSAGGTADHPVQPAFWGGLFGYLTDKFGIQWMLTAETEQQEKS